MKKILILCVIVLFGLGCVRVQAFTFNWADSGTGDWGTVGNWTYDDDGTSATPDVPATVLPGLADTVLVRASEAKVVSNVGTINDLRPGGGNAVRIMNGGTLICKQAKIGAHGGDGTVYIEQGGTLISNGSLTNFEIGKTAGAAANMIQTGGTATFSGARIELGDDAGTFGYYNISGGTLNAQCATEYRLGAAGYGEMNISGTAHVNFNNKNICLGYTAATGSGRINISGGVSNFGYTTILGFGADSSGRIDISGGQTYFARDVITGYTGLASGVGNGNGYFKVVGSGSEGDFIKVSRQFKLDRGVSSTVEFVLDDGGIIPIQTAVDYLGVAGQEQTGFYVDSDTTVILDTLGNIGASVGDKFILATGNQVYIAGAHILDNSDIYDFSLNVISNYVDPFSGKTIKALELEITSIPEPATIMLIVFGSIMAHRRK
jgi:hypothetical protein